MKLKNKNPFLNNKMDLLTIRYRITSNMNHKRYWNPPHTQPMTIFKTATFTSYRSHTNPRYYTHLKITYDRSDHWNGTMTIMASYRRNAAVPFALCIRRTFSNSDHGNITVGSIGFLITVICFECNMRPAACWPLWQCSLMQLTGVWNQKSQCWLFRGNGTVSFRFFGYYRFYSPSV